MAITAADIQNVSFSIDRKGYDVDEVDVFLERVADEVEAMTNLIDDLRLQVSDAEAAAAAAPVAAAPIALTDEEGEVVDAAAYEAKIAELTDQIATLEEQLAEKAANDSAISQALIVAQRSADEIRANARTEASNIIKDADEEADRIIGKAESDRLKITETIRQLESDRADVRAGYRDMLTNFMSDAQKKLAEIDGDARRAAASAQAREVATPYAAPAAAAAAAAPVATYGVAPVASPSASGFIDKDLSGFGAADDEFSFDDID